MRGVFDERHNYSAFVVQSSDPEPRNGAIKDDFHRSKFLIPVANASTGDVYVTTPCTSWWLVCRLYNLTLHGWMIVPCTAAVSLKINFASLQGGFVRTPSNPPWLRACLPFIFECFHDEKHIHLALKSIAKAPNQKVAERSSSSFSWKDM